MLIDKLLADPRFGPRIDATRIGAAGFSLGGYTVLALAGARLSRDQWERFCAEHPDDPNCVERAALYLGVAELIDPIVGRQPDRRVDCDWCQVSRSRPILAFHNSYG